MESFGRSEPKYARASSLSVSETPEDCFCCGLNPHILVDSSVDFSQSLVDFEHLMLGLHSDFLGIPPMALSSEPLWWHFMVFR